MAVAPAERDFIRGALFLSKAKSLFKDAQNTKIPDFVARVWRVFWR